MKSRRGAIYPIVLGTTLIVAVLGLSTLLSVRIQRGQVQRVSDGLRAELYARAAVDMALWHMQHDPDWRQKMQDGVWDVDQPLDQGHYAIQGFDPLDGDLTDSPYDPVVLVGIGKSGWARQQLQVHIDVRQPGLRCLEPVLHAGQGLTFDGATVYSAHFVSANDDLQAVQGSQIHADAEAADSVTASDGSIFHGQTSTDGDWPRSLPDPATVFDDYLSQGTVIPISDLPWWNANLLLNPGIEDGVSPWEAYGSCLLVDFPNNPRSGLQSLKVYNRSAPSDGPGQVITERLQSGETYHHEVWIYPENTDDYRISLELTSTGSGVVKLPMTPWVSMAGNSSWTRLEGQTTVTWEGELTHAFWHVETRVAYSSFRIDDALLKVADAPTGWRALHRRLLSPASNPFGAKVPDSQGIYLIDCQGVRLSVKDCRIVGTLVLLNPHSDSMIHRSMHWVPAAYGPDPAIPNLPALMTNGTIQLATDSTIELDEGQVNFNFNPPGTPYNGTEDTSKNASYPSRIQGLVYSAGGLTVSQRPTIDGVLVAQDEVHVTATQLQLNYDPVYFLTNPPPGFRDELRAEITGGSFQKAVQN